MQPHKGEDIVETQICPLCTKLIRRGFCANVRLESTHKRLRISFVQGGKICVSKISSPLWRRTRFILIRKGALHFSTFPAGRLERCLRGLLEASEGNLIKTTHSIRKRSGCILGASVEPFNSEAS